MKLWDGQNIDWEAYELGFRAWDENKPGNPFEKGTVAYISWRKGWNTNFNGI